MSELVDFHAPGAADDYDGYTLGDLIATAACTVYPAGSRTDTGADFDAATTTLTVLAPTGLDVEAGDECVIRGDIYTITHAGWDWAHGRRPANSLHAPKIQLTADRRESVSRYE